MSYDVIVTGPFERKFKRLAKKYKSLKSDLLPLIESLAEKPNQGTPIGKDCFKIRMAFVPNPKANQVERDLSLVSGL